MIRKSMPRLSRDHYLSYMEEVETLIREKHFEKLKSFDPRSGCLVTNLSRIPSDNLDFGSGPPALIFPLTVEKNSVAVMADKENYILRFSH